jgi:putative transposase
LRKTYKYRLYPTKSQVESLEFQRSEACRLYNAALQERRDAYKFSGVSISYRDQSDQLKEIRDTGNLELANFSACQDVLRRVNKTFQGFFSRIRKGKKTGYPRFKSIHRFDSFTFPSYGDGIKLLDSGKLRIQGVGIVKTKLHRAVEGKIKTVTIKKECGRWYACFSVVCEPESLPESKEVVGIDVGLTAFATLSHGEEIENPRHYRKAQRKLRLAQRKVARRNRGSKRRRKAVVLLQRAHEHIRKQRADFHHKLASMLVMVYGFIAIEDLNIKGLASGMLAKSVNDAGWGSFIEKLSYKAENAGRQLVKVDPRGTSQTCLCGASVPKDLSQRWHQCSSCGLSASRDHVSAQLILGLGLAELGTAAEVYKASASLQALTWNSSSCVA